MDTKREKMQNVRTLMTSILICLLFIPNSYSYSCQGKEVPMGGGWTSGSNNEHMERSLPTHPITAYLIGNYIQIMNEKPDCDITISIINGTTGDIVYQQTVPQAATSNMMISVTDLASGEYILELTGPNTRHLEGSFIK